MSPEQISEQFQEIGGRIRQITEAVIQLQEKVFGRSSPTYPESAPATPGPEAAVTGPFQPHEPWRAPEPAGANTIPPVAAPAPTGPPETQRLPRTVALVIGHTKSSPGACNANGWCEFAFNEALAQEVKKAVKEVDPHIKVEVVYREDSAGGYSRLPARINALHPDFIICMHLNGFDGPAGEDPQGTETLHANISVKGRRLAELVQAHMIRNLRRRDRGIRPRSIEGRGGTVLFGTRAPCVIAEPAFIESDEEFGYLQANRAKLVTAYRDAIVEAARRPEIIST